MNLSIVIPNYNGEDILKKNLPKVFDAISSYKDGRVEVVIIDDHSTDNSINVLENLIPKFKSSFPDIEIKLVKNEKNIGFSSNINKGVRSTSGDVLIMLNTDVAPKKGFLNPLLKHFSDPNVFAVGCMDESVEDSKTTLRGRGIGKWQRGFLVHARGEVDKTNTLWVNGGSGSFRKSIWEKLGGFNELYSPFYWEDIDLSYRAVKSGYKIVFEPKSVVVHEHDKGAIKKKFSTNFVKTIAYRNQFIFIWKNTTDLDLQLYYLLWFPYHFIKALVRLDLDFFKGFLSAFILLPEIIKYKFEEQKLFLLKDKEVVLPFRQEKN